MARKPSEIININGETWITVEVAAKILRTTTPKVRELMGSGVIDSQHHPSRNKVVVPTKQVMAYRDSPDNPNRGKGLPLPLKAGQPPPNAKMIDAPPALGRGAGAVSWPYRRDER